MQFARLIRHATATHWRTRMLFPSATLDAIEQAIAPARSGRTPGKFVLPSKRR